MLEEFMVEPDKSIDPADADARAHLPPPALATCKAEEPGNLRHDESR